MDTSSSTSITQSHADILLVDDSPNLCRTMQLWFQTLGYSTLTAKSATEAQQLSMDQTPRVVIADLGLPDRSGYALLKTLQEIETLRQSHFIALSGDTDSQTKEQALQAGFEYFISKPPDFEELSEILRNCLGGRQTDDQTAAVT